MMITNYEELDKTGYYLISRRAKIESVEPKEGKEGDIITLKGSGFSEYIRNNCIVVGGMGACARAQPGSTDTELKVRIDPVPKRSEGEILVWIGSGSNFYNEKIGSGQSQLRFSETAIFRNGTPVTAAGVNFKLTEASQYAFGGEIVLGAANEAKLSGHEFENVIRVKFPADFKIINGSQVDVCLILKEHPTLAIDFTAEIEDTSLEACLEAIAKTVMVNGNHIGERIFADVVKNSSTNELELYITKPYLENGLMTVHFAMGKEKR
jgi:hypothetical protein